MNEDQNPQVPVGDTNDYVAPPPVTPPQNENNNLPAMEQQSTVVPMTPPPTPESAPEQPMMTPPPMTSSHDLPEVANPPAESIPPMPAVPAPDSNPAPAESSPMAAEPSPMANEAMTATAAAAMAGMATAAVTPDPAIETTPQPAIPAKDGQSQFAPPPTAPKKKSMLPLLLIILGLLILGAVGFFLYNSYMAEQERIAAEQQAAIEAQAQIEMQKREEERLAAEAEAQANAEEAAGLAKIAALQELQSIFSASTSALAEVTPTALGVDSTYFGYDEYYCEAGDNYYPYMVTSQILVAPAPATMTEADMQAQRTALETQLTNAGWLPRTLEFCSTGGGEEAVATGLQPSKMISFFEKDGVQVALYVNPTDAEGSYSDPVVQTSPNVTLEAQIFSDLDAQVKAQQPFTSMADYTPVADTTPGIARMPLENTSVTDAIDWAGPASTSASIYKAFYDGIVYRVDMDLTDGVWTASGVYTQAI